MMPIRDPEMIHINSSPEAPPPRIRILDTRAREVETVRIGDRLTFRIEIPEDSKCSFLPFSIQNIVKLYEKTSFQLLMVYLHDLALPWLRIQRAPSKSSMMMGNVFFFFIL